jgi:GxxExxY protein
VERWGKSLLDAAFEVHTVLGPGFIERIYEDALCHELRLRSIPFERQKAIFVPYKDLRLGYLINFNVPHLKTGIRRVIL